MSYQYTVTERRRRTANTGGYGHSGHRSTFGYWVPLVVTVTAAAIGVAAWVWSERRDDEEEPSEEEHYQGGVPPPGYASMSGALPAGPPPPGGYQGPPGPGPEGLQGPQMMPGPNQPGGFPGYPPPGFQGPGPDGYREAGGEFYASRSTAEEDQVETGFVARMSSALGFGRSTTPSQPLTRGDSAQQPYDWANKPFASGVAAAGAMVGAAISSIRGDGGEGYEDHERWSEEVEQRESGRDVKQGIKRRGTADEFFSGDVEIPRESSIARQKRKTVAVVVSAAGLGSDGGVDHASILSHLPEYVDPDTTRIFVLIYAPELKTHPLGHRRPSQSMTSSFSNISQAEAHTPAQTPGDFPSGTPDDGILAQVDPKPVEDGFSAYKALRDQALTIVDRETMILPFTSSKGHKHILRSLAPELVYIQESLCGADGEIISELSGWVRQTVVVIGDEGGHGGLVDTDDESVTHKPETWWQKEERTGLGKRVGVVESLKIGEDWQRRINDRD